MPGLEVKLRPLEREDLRFVHQLTGGEAGDGLRIQCS